MNVLHIGSSALGSASASRQLTAAAVKALRELVSDVTVTYRDLAEAPPSHLSGHLLQLLRAQPGAQSPEPSAGMAAEVQLTETLIQELLLADVLVLGSPMINFYIPNPLNSWFDRSAKV